MSLKIGDEIVTYKLVGDATEAAALTLDCKLVRVNLADPLTTSDIAGGGMTQIDADGDFVAKSSRALSALLYSSLSNFPLAEEKSFLTER